ncbi:MAG TPA: cell division protein ZapA [Pyrinomonadaceae bacterium]|jgi:cell division protein ZapA|nr:cell division protein ZapA [Pyrinomonadaceae bacterium]
MSSDAPKPPFKSVEVNIFNQVYSLRTNREVEHIRRIAGLVDERMRLISAHTTAHDLAKIAIFAALNIADELSDTHDHYEREFQKLLTRQTENGDEAERIVELEQETAHAGETAAVDAPKSTERQSWFEDIFDSPDSDAAKDRGERLSSKVSAKLQSLRQQPKQETSFSIEEDN